MELFPEDAGENGKTRIIPYLPGQKLFVNDAVCKQRRVELDQYLQELFNVNYLLLLFFLYIISIISIVKLFFLKNLATRKNY